MPDCEDPGSHGTAEVVRPNSERRSSTISTTGTAAVREHSAQLMVKRHGEDAAIQAGMRADELLAEGNVDGAATWRVIIRAIEELQRATPREGEAVN